MILAAVAAVLAGTGMQTIPVPPSPPSAASSVAEAEYREALDLVYGGHGDAAFARIAALRRARPPDPTAAHVHPLAMAWKVEQRPDATTHDRELEQRAMEAVDLADAALRASPADARALFARGAAHGVLSRYHLFRWNRTDAARAAVRMRGDLLEVRR